jgi:hypothetical protein
MGFNSAFKGLMFKTCFVHSWCVSYQIVLFIYLYIFLSIHAPIYLQFFYFSYFCTLSLSLQYFNFISASVSMLKYAFMYFHVCALIVLIWTVMASEYTVCRPTFYLVFVCLTFPISRLLSHIFDSVISSFTLPFVSVLFPKYLELSAFSFFTSWLSHDYLFHIICLLTNF